MQLSEKSNNLYQGHFSQFAGSVHGNAVAPIKKILMVGAILNKANENALQTSDHGALCNALQTLSEHGGIIHPDFEVSVVNCDPNFGGEDFLKDYPEKTDLIIICYLYDGYWPEPGRLTQSPLHFQPGIWHERAVETGAKAIYIVANGGALREAMDKEPFMIPGGQFRLVCEERGYLNALLFHRDYHPIPKQETELTVVPAGIIPSMPGG